jgi:diguanylate cyclase (GGDEF)-like protein
LTSIYDPNGLANEEMMELQENFKRTDDSKGSSAVQTTISLFKRTFQQIRYKELPLDHLVFLYVVGAAILMSIFGLGYNMLRGLGMCTLPVFVVYLVLTLSSVFYSVVKKRWYGAAIVVVGSSVFLLIPFLWFTVGGATGSTVSLMLTGGLCIALVFKRPVRTCMLIMEAVMLVAFIALEYHFPDIIIHYSTRTEHYSDLAFGVTMSLVVNSILAFTVMGHYVRVRDEKTRLVHRLELLSLTDDLTGLYNRRFLSASIDEEMCRAYETGSQLTLCILDIDHFKEVNDTYGHEYGDEVLFNVAQIMKACFTEEEIFGRYGGEEFLVLFPGKTPREALPVVRALGDHVRTHAWSHDKPVTLSGGLSSYVKGISYSNFIEAADINLYRAKQEGRDRIIYR